MTLWGKLFGKKPSTDTQSHRTPTATAVSRPSGGAIKGPSSAQVSDDTQHVVVLASRSGESFNSSPDAIAALESLAGTTLDVLATRARFAMFRNNPRPVSDAKNGTGIVALEALTLLGSTLPAAARPPLLDRFMTAASNMPVRYVRDSLSGEEFAIVVFFDDDFRTATRS